MPLNIFVSGNPASVRATANAVSRIAAGVDDAATGWHRTRTRSEADWEGQAGDAFRQKAVTTARDADALSELFTGLSRALTTFADELTTVKSRMTQAQQVATSAGLKMMGKHLILEPGPTPLPPDQQNKQQAAFQEARDTINHARGIEKAAHERLNAALKANSDRLGHLSSAGSWAQTAAAATSPAAKALSSAAGVMDDRAATATKGMLEKAAATSPAAVAGMWGALTSAQRTDLMDRFPQMVGNTDGIPAIDRHAANRSLISQQRQQLLTEIRKCKNYLDSSHPGEGDATKRTQNEYRLEHLQAALDGLNKVDAATAEGKGRYLLSLDSLANGRGQVIIASGNPDTAQHVATTVPGTYSSLGDAMGYVEKGDNLIGKAQQLSPNESFAFVTYVNYESPESLTLAGMEHWAEDGSKGLSQFQEGLRATHQGDTPSHNTVIGHSYGTTELGYAARDHGMPADDVVFIGSPGVGVEHARELGLPPEHVWSGTSGIDPIKIARAPDPSDWNPANDMWFGRNPSDPSFGGRELPTGTWAGHGDYWENKESSDGMARIIAGKAG